MADDAALEAVVNTALSVVDTVESGKPFIFEAEEGDFLVFRSDDGAIGVISVDDVRRCQKGGSMD